MAKKSKKSEKKAVGKKAPSTRKSPRRKTGKKLPDPSENAPPGEVGYKRPPKEHQWQPGQSGNPDGRPRDRTNLWQYFTKYLAMTPTQLSKASRSKSLTLAEIIAIRFVRQIRDKIAKCKPGDLPAFIRYLIDRDEGKATERVEVRQDHVLTEQECEEIRRAMEGRGDRTLAGD